MNLQAGTSKNIAGWIESQIRLNVRVIKYGLVACTGILVNLGTLALLFTVSSERGWVESGIANTAATVGNFVLHNIWTFSDRRHQGVRLVRGFLSFAFMSAVGISITTAAFVGFARVAAHLRILNSHLGALGIVLICQFFAILIGGSFTYALNREFTWARTDKNASADTTPVEEIRL